MATFADDTAVMAVGETVKNSTRRLQSATNKAALRTEKMVNKIQRIKIGMYRFYRQEK
jgi:hypothetical protein